MNKQQIKTIEAEIEQLSQQRATLFNEWINVVKQNDRNSELYGEDKPEEVAKAHDLLMQQRQINQKIMQLLAKLDNIVLRPV
jgi:septal ring factor EnvC (AmiA/AmiB activator)